MNEPLVPELNFKLMPRTLNFPIDLHFDGVPARLTRRRSANLEEPRVPPPKPAHTIYVASDLDWAVAAFPR